MGHLALISNNEVICQTRIGYIIMMWWLNLNLEQNLQTDCIEELMTETKFTLINPVHAMQMLMDPSASTHFNTLIYVGHKHVLPAT